MQHAMLCAGAHSRADDVAHGDHCIGNEPQQEAPGHRAAHWQMAAGVHHQVGGPVLLHSLLDDLAAECQQIHTNQLTVSLRSQCVHPWARQARVHQTVGANLPEPGRRQPKGIQPGDMATLQ